MSALAHTTMLVLKGPATADNSARVDRKESRSGRSTPPQVGKLGGKERQRRGESKEIGILIDIGNSEGEGVLRFFQMELCWVSINEYYSNSVQVTI